MNDKIKDGELREEVDDSGFFAGKSIVNSFVAFCSSLVFTCFSVISPGGPVPQVGVTITMDDQLLNGTNRVVLDGVMTQKECDRILQLAVS